MLQLLDMEVKKVNLTKHFFLPSLNFLFIFLVILSIIASCKQIVFSSTHSEDEIEALMNDYVKAWSDGDVSKIVDQIYEPPITIRYQDSLVILGNKERVKDFLIKTFKKLESNNYGYSIINNWESKTLDENIVSFKMNYTRFLKDGSIMGEINRETSYVLKKNDNGNYKIKSLIPTTPIE